MRGIVCLMFLALLFIDSVTQAQSPTGSMILAEGFASPNTYTGPLPGFGLRVLRRAVLPLSRGRDPVASRRQILIIASTLFARRSRPGGRVPDGFLHQAH